MGLQHPVNSPFPSLRALKANQRYNHRKNKHPRQGNKDNLVAAHLALVSIILALFTGNLLIAIYNVLTSIKTAKKPTIFE